MIEFCNYMLSDRCIVCEYMFNERVGQWTANICWDKS